VGCRVLNLSQSGRGDRNLDGSAAPVGVVVTIGMTRGRVVRHIEDCFAIEFTRLQQHPDFVEDNVTAP